MPDALPTTGDVAAMPLHDGAWGACQVTNVTQHCLVVVALAWHSPQPPTLDDLAGIGPLIIDHHNWLGQPEHSNVPIDYPVPAEFAWLGKLPVPPELDVIPNSYQGWDGLPLQVVAQHKWDQLPEAVRRGYKAGATRGPVEVDFGAGPVTKFGATSRLDLTGDDPAVPADGDVRWSALDQLPQCSGLVRAGPDRGLGAALRDRPLIGNLVWRDPPSTIDLRGTSLGHLTLDGPVIDLNLPRSLRQLTLSQQGSGLAVTAPDDGRWLDLNLATDGPYPTVPAGLDSIRTLAVTGRGRISAVPLRGLAELRALWLAWQGPPGELLDADSLADLGHLTVLKLHDAYGLDTHTLPAMPSLRHLDVYGLRRSIVKPLRVRYRDIRLVLRGAKSDTWLAANLANPLRDWVDGDEKAGRAACKAYAETVRALDKVRTPDEARPILQALVDKLNGIEKRYQIIDTLRREQAGDAFVALATRAGVPQDTADEWFDDWRDF